MKTIQNSNQQNGGSKNQDRTILLENETFWMIFEHRKIGKDKDKTPSNQLFYWLEILK